MSNPADLRKSAMKGTDLLIAVLVVLIVAAVIEYLLNVHAAIFSVTIMMIAVLSIIIGIRIFAPGYMRKVAPDERIRKARARAISYSWLLTIAFMTALQLADNIYRLNMTANKALMYTLLFTTYSFLFLSWYYGRKPDVELV